MAEPHIPVNRTRLSCRICTRLLRVPVTIPCGHNFCLQCIEVFWDWDEADFSCPECWKNFPSKPHLIRNTALAEMVKDTERSEDREKDHPTGSRQKRPRSSEETSDRNVCRRHQSPLNVYCCTDERIICVQCASTEHVGHRFGIVGLERSRKQEELKKIQMKMRQILQEQERNHERMEELSEQIQEQVTQTEDQCEGVIVRVIDSLQKHYLSVRELIGAQAAAAAARVHASLQTLETKMEEMKRIDAELERLGQSKNNVQFLQKWPSMMRLCNEDHFQLFNETSEELLSPFEVTKRAVEKLGTQLEGFCDKGFASISHTPYTEEQEESGGEEGRGDNTHGQTGINRNLSKQKELRTREEFLQYACDLSLDPTTAHKDLIISEEDKKVMLCSDKCQTPSVRYPQRFIHRRQVLCREGLQAERCYYEVEVEGEKAEIAITYKEIDRKSSSKTSAFGANANSWSLDRCKTYSVSHKDQSVLLTARPCSKKIGVYLKFREGTVSFYEVLNSNMTFLYKLEADFTESLYPGFWLGEKCSIKICDLRQ